MTTVKEMGDGEEENFCEYDFEKCFNKIDTDGDSYIDKNEMFEFIWMVSGINYAKIDVCLDHDEP